MVETCVGPSELHLKKELTVLQKARCLRDPETCSSWRSPLTSRSLAAASILNCENGSGNLNGMLQPGGLVELPLRSDNKCKVYLYNWKHHSSKSSDAGSKVDEEKLQDTVDGGPDKSFGNPQPNNSLLEFPTKTQSMRGNNSQNPVRRKVRRPRRNPISRKRVVKHLALSRLHDMQSTSLVSLVERTDDTEYCESGEIQNSANELAWKNGCPASPVLSRSGCGNWSCSSGLLRSFKRDESSQSCTPASTSSYNRYGPHNPSTLESLDGTTASVGGDELDQPDLPGRQVCGIPCYWSKRTNDKGLDGCYSPSLSDSLRRRGSSLLCGSQTLYNKKKGSDSYKRNYLSKSSQGLPLLYTSCDVGCSSLETGSDDLSTNFGELDLEALSRLDGRRWSSCKSQEGMELPLPGSSDVEELENRSLSQKYRPKSFDDIVGQTLVVQSLRNAVSRGRIAPAYLFQGPRGTGKTSAARIFATALNCLSTEANKPCGLCSECAKYSEGDDPSILVVDATYEKGIEKIKYFLRNMATASTFSRYKIFIVDESHMLSAKLWFSFMKYLEEPPPRLVFMFLTIDPDNLPRAVVSRCQKYLFPKIKDLDIVSRLRKISVEENLDIDLDALELIASNADGSLRDAETMLDQLSLMGKKITTSLVNDLVGVVSDEKLLELLKIALSSDTAETVKRSRELMDSGVDPMALMSQLASLIMDIIAGTYRAAHLQSNSTILASRSLTDVELDRLQRALKILSDAEKQIRLSSERSTWFTAALLQLGGHILEPNRSSCSSKQSGSRVNDVASDRVKGSPFYGDSSHSFQTLLKPKTAFFSRRTSGSLSSPVGQSSQVGLVSQHRSQSADRKLISEPLKDDANGKSGLHQLHLDNMEEIWKRCVERCHSKTLRGLLYAHGKLVSIVEAGESLVAFIAFSDASIKSRAERFLSSLTDSFEIVLRKNVQVRLGFLPDKFMEICPSSLKEKHKERALNISSDKDRNKITSNLPRNSLDYSEGRKQEKCYSKEQMVHERFQVACNPTFTEGTNLLINRENSFHEVVPAQRHTASTDEQRLESAWLQTAEKSTSGSVNHLKLEKNQVWPQNGTFLQNENMLFKVQAKVSKDFESELGEGVENLGVSDSQSHRVNQSGTRLDHLAISPSLLHSRSFVDKDNMGYESGPGCNGLLCWNTRKTYTGKVKQGSFPGLSQQKRRLSLFGECGKRKTSGAKFRR